MSSGSPEKKSVDSSILHRLPEVTNLVKVLHNSILGLEDEFDVDKSDGKATDEVSRFKKIFNTFIDDPWEELSNSCVVLEVAGVVKDALQRR